MGNSTVLPCERATAAIQDAKLPATVHKRCVQEPSHWFHSEPIDLIV